MSSTGRVPLLDENDRFPDRFAPPSVAADAAAAEVAREGSVAAASDAEAARDESVAAAVRAEAVPAQVDTAMAEQVGTGGEFDTKLNATIGDLVQPVADEVVDAAITAADVPGRVASALEDPDVIASAGLVTRTTADATYSTGAATNHLAHRANVRRAKGGVIGTSGKPVMSFRGDHGADDFLSTFWPLFRARGIPVSYGVVTDSIENPTDSYEPTTTTWAQLRTASSEGFEVWSHSATHRRPTDLHHEIIESADELEANGLRVMGWQTPGVPGDDYPNYGNNWGGDFNHEVGQLLLSRYGLYEAAELGGQVRFLPMSGDSYGLGHYTVDNVTLAVAKGYLDAAVSIGGSIQFLFHPLFINQGSTMTVPDFAAFLDYVVSLWDAGKIEILTASGMAFADPGSTHRVNLIRDGSFEDGTTLDAPLSPWSVSSAGTGGTAINTDGGKTGSNYLSIPVTGQFTSVMQDTPFGFLDSFGMRGATFMFEGWVRCVGSDTTARVSVRDANSPARMALAPTFLVTQAQGWRRIRVPFTLHPDTSILRVMVGRTSGNGVIDWDDIKVMPT